MVDLSLNEAVKQLNAFELTSQELVVVYSIRAGTIGKHFGYITEDNFVQAL